MRMKTAIYARVSTDNKGQDLELQFTDLRRYCAAMDWHIHKEYSDQISGFKGVERPSFSNMMCDARLRKFDCVMVHDFSRFSRETPTKAFRDLDDLVRLLKIRFISLKDGIDSNNPWWEAIMVIMSVQANNYSKVLSDKVKAGMQRAKEKGRKLGRKRKNVDVDLILKLRREGRSIRQIAKKVTTKQGGIVSYQTIYRALKQNQIERVK